MKYLDCDNYYPIDYSMDDGRVTACAVAYDRTGDVASLIVSGNATRDGWREVSRLCRAWLHGRQLTHGGQCFQLRKRFRLRGALA